MRFLKQSAAANVMVFMKDAADHVTGKAGLTLAVTASKDGGAFAAISPTVTERGNGWYSLALTASHTDTLGDLALNVTAAGADPSPLACRVIAVDLADAVRGGLTALPNANAGANGGLHVLGTNAFAVSYTAGVTISNASGSALTLSSSGGNGSGLSTSGNGSGSGVRASGGATGHGVNSIGGSTSGSGIVGSAPTSGQGMHLVASGSGNNGLLAIGNGTGNGIRANAGATGNGLRVDGGTTSGAGVSVTTTLGDGVSISPTGGHGIVASANGASKHGLLVTGGNSGTCDGLKAVAGTGGVDVRGNLVGNVTGNLSGSVGSVTGAVGSVTGNVAGSVGSVTNAVTTADAANIAAILQDTGTDIPAALAAVAAKTNLIPVQPAAVGSPMTLADGAITEGTIVTPPETAGRPTTLFGMWRRVFEWHSNKRTRDRATGAVTLRNEADSAALEAQVQQTQGKVDSQSKGA